MISTVKNIHDTLPPNARVLLTGARRSGASSGLGLRLIPAPGDNVGDRMTGEKGLRISGGLVVVVGVLGFLTVADDVRHTGELWGSASLLTAGMCLLLAGYGCAISRWLAVQWFALGLLAGVPVGAWLDDMPMGVAVCAAIGLGVAYLRRPGSTGDTH